MKNKQLKVRLIILCGLLGNTVLEVEARMNKGARGYGYRGVDDERPQTRAPRSNLAAGSPISPFNCAELAEIKQCCCLLKSLVESKFDVLISLVDVIIDGNCCSLVEQIDSKIDIIESLIDNASCCSLVEHIDDVIGSFGDLGITSMAPTCPFTTLDAINDTDLTVIGWLKSIMAQLVGV